MQDNFSIDTFSASARLADNNNRQREPPSKGNHAGHTHADRTVGEKASIARFYRG